MAQASSTASSPAEEAIPGLDLKALMAQFTAAQLATQKSKDDLAKEQVDLKAEVATETAANTAAADLAGQINTALGMIQITAANRKAQATADFHANPDAQGYVMANLADEILARKDTLQKSASDFAKKVAIGPTDDIFQWITNQFTLPREAAAHNAKVKEQEIAMETLSKLQDGATKQAGLNAGIDANTTAGILALQAERELKIAESTNSKLRIAAGQINSNLISVRLAADETALRNITVVNESQFKVEQLKLAKAANAISAAHLSISQADHALRQKEMQLKLEERSEKAEVRTRLTSDLAQVSSFLGYGRAVTLDEFNKMSGATRNKFEFALTNQSILEGRYGATPADAIETINALQPKLPNSQVAIVGKMNEDISRAIQGGKTGQGSQADIALYKTMTPQEQRKLQNKGVADSVAAELKAIPESGGYFSLPPMKALGGIPGVQATKLWKEHFAPLAQNVQQVSSPAMMFSVAKKAVLEGKITAEQAGVELATIVDLGVQDNLVNNNYTKLGIAIPSAFLQDGKLLYRATMPTGNIFGARSESLIFNSKTAVYNRLLQEVAKEKSYATGVNRYGD